MLGNHGHGYTATTSTLLRLYFALLLAVASVRTNKGAVYPNVKFKGQVVHGHLYVTWVVDKNFAHSLIPINYNIDFCPNQLNDGIIRCNVSKTVCAAIYNGQTHSGSIQHYPGNITDYLDGSKPVYEDMNDTIELRGPFIESNWKRETMSFSCRIFTHRCMDKQFQPLFAYTMHFNGSTTEDQQEVNFSIGAPVKTENVTIETPVQHGCCSFSVVVRWQIIHVCKVDVPSFKIWLKHNDKIVSNINLISNVGRKVYTFMTSFSDLSPQTLYTLHIEGYKPFQYDEDKNASHINKSFRTPKLKINVALARLVQDGYLSFSWSMNDTTDYNLGGSNAMVQYNLSWCPESSNPPPFTCKKASPTFCQATYYPNGTSTPHVHTKQYAKQLTHYPDFIKVLNITTKRRKARNFSSWVKSWWDVDTRQFTCQLWLNPCELDNYPVYLQYQMLYNHQLFTDHQRTTFGYGFIGAPDSIRVSNHFTGDNTVKMVVSWSYQQVCAMEASKTSIIWITKEGSEQRESRKDKGRGVTSHHVTSYENVFQDLQSFTVYTIHIRGDRDPEVTRQIRTPEGVPTSSPVLEPVIDKDQDCVDNKRNLSIRWKPPSQDKRNGIIRHNQVLCWKKSQDESEKKPVNLGNTTSYLLVGLDCDVEYHVKVRACLQLNNRCSRYSDVQYLSAVQLSQSSSNADKNISDVFLWASIAVAVLFVLAASYVCQRLYHRRTRVPLEPFEESSINNGYARANDVELTTPGTYCFLVENEEDF